MPDKARYRLPRRAKKCPYVWCHPLLRLQHGGQTPNAHQQARDHAGAPRRSDAATAQRRDRRHIAEALHVSPRTIKRYLRAELDQVAASNSDRRDLIAAQADQLLAVWLPRALGGDPPAAAKAAAVVSAVWARIERLYGLPAPTRATVTVSDADIAALARRLADAEGLDAAALIAEAKAIVKAAGCDG